MEAITESVAKRVLDVVDAGLCRGVGVPIPGQMCVEAAVCYAIGEPHSDEPSCVAKIVRNYKVRLNDAAWSSDAARAHGMRRVAIAQLGSLCLDEQKFARIVSEQGIRQLLPPILRTLGLIEEAKRCEVEGSYSADSAASAAARAARAASAASAARAARAASAASAAYSAAYSAADSAADSAASAARAARAASAASAADSAADSAASAAYAAAYSAARAARAASAASAADSAADSAASAAYSAARAAGWATEITDPRMLAEIEAAHKAAAEFKRAHGYGPDHDGRSHAS